jgi:uncharacterized iron-regulated membrane protein
MQGAQEAKSTRSWPDYRAVWRWHFYAGLWCIPFVIVLSISGTIYLFKPQIEAWSDRAYDHLEFAGRPAPVAAQVAAALAALPGSTPNGYELPRTPQAAARVIVSHKGQAIRMYVHPETLRILHQVREDQRFTRWIFRLHGELLMGNRGSNLVELAASWTIVMILTGLYLWWPRQAKGLGGILYPRLTRGSKIFWRDIHSVVGVYVSAFALFLLLTGLPWAKFWGGYFKTVRQLTGTAVARQDWSTGSERPSGSSRAGGGGLEGLGGGTPRGSRAARPMPKDMAAFDRVVAAVRPLGLDHPIVIAPPEQGSDAWTAKSMTANRPRRVNLVVDGTTGAIVSREDFKDRHPVDRMVSVGIAAHEGQLFGWPNQALGVFTATGLILMSVSGVIMWWRRRDPGVLGAPKFQASPRVASGLVVLVVLLGAYLPLFGLSLLLVLIVERTLLRRIPRVRDWLGLYVAAAPPQYELASSRFR